MVYISIGCLAYYLLLCLTLRKWDATFSRFWLAVGLAGIAVAYITDRAGISCPVFGIILAGGVVLMLPCIPIFSCMCRLEETEVSCLIVLGAQVKGRKITDSLRRRLERALCDLKKQAHIPVIVSGGKGKGEEVTEAEAMAQYLCARGVKTSRIIRESHSRTTEENLRFSSVYIENLSLPVGIVSNNFHIYRAICYARRAGYERPVPMPAGCHRVLFVNYLVRECLAIWKMWIMGGKA